jgi:5-methylcytosine-specific restriction endonuclease McrA
MKAERTKALEIPQKVKSKVAKRDSVDGWACCVLCGTPAPTYNPIAFSCCHYIARSQGGLGIEENIITLCPKCHREYDNEKRDDYRPFLRSYLKSQYANFDEDKLVYKKR